MKKAILITGSNGTIGTVLKKGLSEYGIAYFDLPKDASDYLQILEAANGKDAIIHLAWDTKTENFLSENISPNNNLMTFNVYKAAMTAGVKRVIMASSIHANDFSAEKSLKKVEEIPTPDSPYGASKVFMESLGRYFARKGLEVVCIRFGGVGLNNKPSSDSYTWLSQNDCVALCKTCLEAVSIPNNFAIINAVSKNEGRVHDFANPLGWEPRESAEDFI